jgi:cell wall-associated NlpC family hydrolase
VAGTTPFQRFTQKLGIGPGSGLGFDSYAPQVLQNGQTAQQNQGGQQADATTQYGQDFLDRLKQRKTSGQDIYNNYKSGVTTRLANTLVNQSAGLKFDQFGKPDINLANFGNVGQNMLKQISQSGDLATQAAEARGAYQNAVTMQNLGQYGIGGTVTVSGSDIPGASSGNIGAQAASMAMKVMQNHTSYVWGGNSLVNGVDCSGLVQQIYKRLGVNVPRTTYEQAKQGHVISVNSIRPGDLVFYGGDYHHVGIYIGNGHVIHAANPKLGVIESTLTNSNGAPTLVIRPY